MRTCVTSRTMTKQPTELSVHLKWRETTQTHDGAAPVVVTACGWVNPPKDRVVNDLGETTCNICINNVY